MPADDVQEQWRDLTPEEQETYKHPKVPGFYRAGMDLLYFFSVRARELSIEGQPTFCEIHYRYLNLHTLTVQSCNQTWKNFLSALQPFALDEATVKGLFLCVGKKLDVIDQEKEDLEMVMTELMDNISVMDAKTGAADEAN